MRLQTLFSALILGCNETGGQEGVREHEQDDI